MDNAAIIWEWFSKRKISADVLRESGITFENRKIVIPVRDEFGHHIFNKRRKSPFDVSTAPKYTYEPGSMASLYNVHTIVGTHLQSIFITEGELDTLLLNSMGFFSVSSTGGCAVFKVDWIQHLKNNHVYIVYDRDDAGIRGALKVQKMLPFAKIVFLPHDTKGKDVTDYFQTHTKEEFMELVYQAEQWRLPYDPSDIPETKAGVDAILKQLTLCAEELLERQRRFNSERKETTHIEVLFEMIKNRREYWEKQKKMIGRVIKQGDMDEVTAAKETPISRYVHFNNSGFAKCLWHEESTGSMKYYPEKKHVFCFGCNVRKDVIDVVMKMYNVSFKEALRLILNKPQQKK